MSTLSNASRGHARTHSRPAWSGLAVVVEAITLLLFLVWSLSIVTQLFAAAAARGEQGSDLATAVSLATSTAERFAASPADAEGTTTQDGLTVACAVEPESMGSGTLYHATIEVFAPNQSEPVYTLTTARYQRQVE